MSIRVLIITGPPGVGKTTIATLVSQRLGFTCLSGDAIKNEFFPTIADITLYPEKLQHVKDELLRRAIALYERGQKVVVDYIILGEDYTERYRMSFGNDLQISVLLPSVDVATERDRTREVWTAGADSVRTLHEEFQELHPFVGAKHFFDTAGETPEQTFELHFSGLGSL